MTTAIDPDLLLAAYAQGIFPMGESRHDNTVNWYSTNQRGIIPLDRAHIPARLRRTLLNHPYTVTANRDFAGVVAGCAEVRVIGKDEENDTWINAPIIAAYSELHKRGHAHSVEVWDKGILVGGIYGVALGRAFFGESMFSRVRDASKIALAHLLARLDYHGFQLFDTQFLTPHLQQFGAIAISADDYSVLLAGAVGAVDTDGASFISSSEPDSAGLLSRYLQSTTQIS